MARQAPGCAGETAIHNKKAGQPSAKSRAGKRGDPGVSQRKGSTLVDDHPQVKADATGSLEWLQAISQR